MKEWWDWKTSRLPFEQISGASCQISGEYMPSPKRKWSIFQLSNHFPGLCWFQGGYPSVLLQIRRVRHDFFLQTKYFLPCILVANILVFCFCLILCQKHPLLFQPSFHLSLCQLLRTKFDQVHNPTPSLPGSRQGPTKTKSSQPCLCRVFFWGFMCWKIPWIGQQLWILSKCWWTKLILLLYRILNNNCIYKNHIYMNIYIYTNINMYTPIKWIYKYMHKKNIYIYIFASMYYYGCKLS